MTRPLLALSCALALGTLVGPGLSRSCATILLALAAALLGLALPVRRSRGVAAALGGAALAIGAAAAAVEARTLDKAPLTGWTTSHEGVGPVRIRGTCRSLEDREGRWFLVVDVSALTWRGVERPINGRARIEVGGSAARPVLEEGDRVALWAELRMPRGFANPGSFEATDQARREGIDAFGYCKSPKLLEREGPGLEARLAGAIAGARSWARERLLSAVPPGPEQGLVRAMVLGDRSGVDAETAEAFRAAGTYHVLALSGAQVALLAVTFGAACRRLRMTPGATAILLAAALVLYALFVGGEVPVVRATVMAVVVLLGRALDLDADAANLVGLAGGLLLVHRPSSLNDVGFQLSFAATLGLILLTSSFLVRGIALPLRLEVAVAASLAAQAAIATLLAAHFHRLAPAAIVLNLVAVPLSGAVLATGLGVLAAALVLPPLLPWAGDLAWVCAHGLLLSGSVIRHAPALDLRTATPAAWMFAVHALGLLFLVRGRRRAGLVVVGLAVAAIARGPGPPSADGRLHLTVLDVGQGDCLVLRSPHGRHWLIDAGGGFDRRFDTGESVVAPYLWGQGVRRLEGLVVTHAHPDHVGGVPFLLRAFPVGEVWEGIAPVRDPGYGALDERLRAAGVRRRAVVRGLREDWDGVRIRVLGPPPPTSRPWKTRNDDSVVVAASFGEVTLLLAGDLEAAGEERLGSVRADALKIPHHGSRSSSTPSFVNGLGAAAAVISVGHRSRFGHPHAEVLDRYARAGVRVFRTDRDGAVTLTTDGRTLRAATYRDGWEGRLR